MAKKEKIYYIIDEDGEVVEELGQGYKVHTSEQEYIKKALVPIKMPFLKLNPKAFVKIEKYIKYVVMLVNCIEFETGVLRFKNGKLIKDRKSFESLFGVKKNMANRIIRYLEGTEIIRKKVGLDNDYYVFNPYIAHSGRKVEKSLRDTFEFSRWVKYADED